MQAVRIPPLLSPFVFASWHLAVQYGHWSGEWAMGGFEAKSIAYPFILLGIANVVRDRWRLAWVFLAIGVAWHPLAGGWAGMSVGLYWLSMPALRQRIAREWPTFLLAIGIGLIGVVPAALGLAGENLVGKVVASQVHVYFRLPHHLCPQVFAPERHVAAQLSLLALTVVAVSYFLLSKCKPPAEDEHNEAEASYPVRLLGIAGFAVLFAVVGLVIDMAMTNSHPSTASSLLRFYWFRWADVAVPLASTTLLWICLSRGNPAYYWAKVAPAMVLVIAASAAHVNHVASAAVPAADKLVTESTGPIPVVSDRYIDWLAVCEWIRENTPRDSLWLTPKYQQSFKWYAQRAEVICWKDVPQDNASVHEWYKRIEDCEPPRFSNGDFRGWSKEELIELAEKYEFEWILVDKTVQANPHFEIAYPVNEGGKYIDNRSFAVLRLRPEFRQVFANQP